MRKINDEDIEQILYIDEHGDLYIDEYGEQILYIDEHGYMTEKEESHWGCATFFVILLISCGIGHLFFDKDTELSLIHI